MRECVQDFFFISGKTAEFTRESTEFGNVMEIQTRGSRMRLRQPFSSKARSRIGP